MNANGVPRKLARKVAWAVAMSTAAYGIEALWEGQSWLLDRSDKLSTAIGRAVTGIFSTAMGTGAISIPPTQPAVDQRRERLLVVSLAAPEGPPNEPCFRTRRKMVPVAIGSPSGLWQRPDKAGSSGEARTLNGPHLALAAPHLGRHPTFRSKRATRPQCAKVSTNNHNRLAYNNSV